MNLKLLRGDNCVETFQGNGPIPYAAIRDSYKKARDFLTNINGEFSNGVHAEEDIERESRGREGETDEDSSRQSAAIDGEDDSGGEEQDEEEDEEHDFVTSLQSFWEKALSNKCQECVTYRSREGESGGVIVVCSIGKLTVEEVDTSEEEARQAAASSMMNKIETILEAQGDVCAIIWKGEEDATNPPFKDETAFESEEDDFGEPNTKHAGGDYEERVVSSEEEADTRAVVGAPVTKTQDVEGLQTDMMPGAEYCLGLVRTDKPGEWISNIVGLFLVINQIKSIRKTQQKQNLQSPVTFLYWIKVV